ncbi:MAG: peptidyl-tRNA hydrolase, family [Patescibacteria group bacterium]|nr:peptidyl-tRNA hydrolase, family [Patescibacteria group bacterium]
MAQTFLLLGLGNPGKKYEKTRHNIGANFIKWFQGQYPQTEWKVQKKNLAQIAEIQENNIDLILAFPLVFMNESGKTVSRLKKYYQIPLSQIIVIHDDNDLKIGTFKISFKRGSAGHKGVASIIENLKSNEFYRLRIGIQPLASKRQKAEDLVLKSFSPSEQQIMKTNFPLMKKRLEQEILYEGKA